VARALEIELERLNTDDSYFKSLPTLMKSKRDYMAKFLVKLFVLSAVLKTMLSDSINIGRRGDETVPEGGYFMVVD
jgi:hypothetical protein